MSKLHPEQREGELYIGNVGPETMANSVWTTKRFGRHALDADGKRFRTET